MKRMTKVGVQMALLQVHFHSEILGMDRSMAVLLPVGDRGSTAPGTSRGKWPVLWLLHGRGDDHMAFVRHTAIERHAAAAGLAVVMPSADLSYDSNMAHGGRFFDFFTEELPGIVARFFPFSRERSENTIGGISMGAYGAMKIGLSVPDRYASILCLSGANVVHRDYPLTERRRHLWMSILGSTDLSTFRGTRHDLWTLAQEDRANKGSLPRIAHACGTEDEVYPEALKTRDFFTAMEGNPFRFAFHGSPGNHSWDYRDGALQASLSRLGFPGVRG